MQEEILNACRKAHARGIAISCGRWGITVDDDGLVCARPKDEEYPNPGVCAFGAWLIGRVPNATDKYEFTAMGTLNVYGLTDRQINDFIDGFDYERSGTPFQDAGASIRVTLYAEGILR